MVWVFAGPRKKNNPDVQALNGTSIVISCICPGASAPLDGLNVTPPGTFVKARQFRFVWLLVGATTSAWQT